eukprot:COSAG01_NODE_7323_length_3251_cov_1.566624_5_plen_49_part_00
MHAWLPRNEDLAATQPRAPSDTLYYTAENYGMAYPVSSVSVVLRKVMT